MAVEMPPPIEDGRVVSKGAIGGTGSRMASLVQPKPRVVTLAHCPRHSILTNAAATGRCTCFDGLRRAGAEPAERQAPEPPEPRELLTLRQLVVYSGLSERTLRGYLHRQVQPLPHYRVAKKILVRRADFDHWLDQFRRGADGDEIGRAVDEIFGRLAAP